MKLTNDELEVLEDINCYDDEETLVYEEIDREEIDKYINDKDNWNKSLCEWFHDWLFERIYVLVTKNGDFLFFFDNSEKEIDVDREELLKNVINEYEIENANDYNRINFE